MGKWNKLNFKILTVAIDVYHMLRELKGPGTPSFNDVLRKVLRKEREIAWSFLRPVTQEVKEFWSSELFA